MDSNSVTISRTLSSWLQQAMTIQIGVQEKLKQKSQIKDDANMNHLYLLNQTCQSVFDLHKSYLGAMDSNSVTISRTLSSWLQQAMTIQIGVQEKLKQKSQIKDDANMNHLYLLNQTCQSVFDLHKSYLGAMDSNSVTISRTLSSWLQQAMTIQIGVQEKLKQKSQIKDDANMNHLYLLNQTCQSVFDLHKSYLGAMDSNSVTISRTLSSWLQQAMTIQIGVQEKLKQKSQIKDDANMNHLCDGLQQCDNFTHFKFMAPASYDDIDWCPRKVKVKISNKR
eukprot:403366699